MMGAIAGDIIGSVFEWNNIKTTEFPLFCDKSRFTDDTVLTIATADCILNKKSYAEAFRYWGRKYPDAGYGGNFARWLLMDDLKPYNSWGNGSAMRVSPVGFAFGTLFLGIYLKGSTFPYERVCSSNKTSIFQFFLWGKSLMIPS